MAASRLLGRIGFYAVVAFFSLFAVIPVLWMLITIFKQHPDLYTPQNNPFLYNLPPTVEHLKFLIADTNYVRFLWNSFFIGALVVGITLVLAIPAAYSLARLTGRWGERSGIAIFLIYLIPPTLLFIPLFQVVSFLGLADTRWSLVLVYPTITVPFCTWLLLGFFKSIPPEIEEAAMVDGCSRLLAFWKVALPLAMPGVVTSAVFAFGLSLHDYIYAAIFISSSASRTVSAGVPTELIRGDVFYWQTLMGGAALVAIPLALAYGLLFNRLVSGFQASAGK
jgi:multiple sugar transport system permease protein